MDEKCRNCKHIVRADTWSGYKCKLSSRPIANINKRAWCNYFQYKPITPGKKNKGERL